LSPGSYDVDVELEGFKKWTQSNVKLDAAAKVVLDVTLETGGLSESVVVEARTTPLQFDSQNRKTIELKDVQDMAINGRNPINLPEYGRSSGGQIRFITKGGGHDFHGSLYDYVRNNKFDANSWSRNAANNPLLVKPAPLHYNQFGGTFGGPLTIPGKFNTNRD